MRDEKKIEEKALKAHRKMMAEANKRQVVKGGRKEKPANREK